MSAKSKAITPTPSETVHRPSLTVGGVAFDLKLSLVIFLVGMLPIINHYFRISAWLARKGTVFSHLRDHSMASGWDQVLLFLLIPLLAVIAMREKPSAYGFGLGKWREGLIWMAGICPMMFIAMYFTVRWSPEMRDYYLNWFYPSSRTTGFISDAAEVAGAATGHLFMLYLAALLIVPWEYMLRGFFLFGLAPTTGPGAAIFLQAIPFALLHIGKPLTETITTVAGGVCFGFVAWRTQSFLYAAMLHYFMLVSLNLWCWWLQ